MTAPAVIQLTEHIAQPPARVWQALTEPELMAKWWAPGDISPEVGHRFSLDMGAFGKQQCEVIEVDEPRRFAYRFGIGFLDTMIVWTLAAADGGTDLTLEHSGFDMDSPMGQQAFQGMSGGWPSILTSIEPALGEDAR